MAEVIDVLVPDIGDFSDVPVIEILVDTGQAVQVDDPLVTLESDKATMEIPAPSSGVVSEILVKLGDKVSEGAPLVKLAVDADAGAPSEPAAPGAIEGGIQAGASGGEAAPAAEPPAAAEPAPPPPASEAGADAPYASPSVRKRARELGVDLSTITGSGRKGRITVEDLEAKPAAAAAAPAGSAAPGDQRVALTRIQKIAGPRLQSSWQQIPHVTQHDEADITELEAFRKQVNAEQDKAKVTMVALLMKACVPALRAFPTFNAQLDGEELILKGAINLGFAADTPQGLVVPVIKDVENKGILALATELRELSGKAREGKLGPAEMSGGTFTISSLGGIGGTAFTPIVNAPQVAILGVSKSAMKPVWDGAQFVPRLMVPLSLSYDHRVIDGAAAARFTVYLASVLSDLRRVLL